ncbi:hypothetical protein HYS84_03190 [Candidatus Saccharibacteria bacterium]|nr:hypothetical protein [Candidatus Saccharibacteria bacterium]
MDVYEQAAEKIIEEQANIIGPLALEQAQKVSGLQVDKSSHRVSFNGDKTTILDHLVGQYKDIFGQTSVEVCKEAARSFLAKLPSQEVPSLLR